MTASAFAAAFPGRIILQEEMQMKASHRAFVCVVFFTIAGTLSSSASSLLCSAGPTATLVGSGNWRTIYSCTIPANTVPTGQGHQDHDGLRSARWARFGANPKRREHRGVRLC